MGGGGQVSQNASYAPEFRPIAQKAGEQVIQMMNANPILPFAGLRPQGTAGMSPWQQMGMSMIPHMAMTTDPMLQMGQIPSAVTGAALGSAITGDITPAAQRALASFDKYGSPVGTNAFSPARESLYTQAAQSLAPYMPQNYQQPWAFQGLSGVPATPDLAGQINQFIATLPSQVLYGTTTGSTTAPSFEVFGPGSP